MTHSLRGRRVLVTGAGGFIGSHLCERLVREGASVRAFVRYNALGARGWLDDSPLADEMEIIAGDIADADAVATAARGCDAAAHLAALIGIPYSYQAPRSYVRTNIEGTLNVLQAAREHGLTRVVHTSTSEVYGSAQRAPIDEGHPLVGQSPYAASKTGADQIALSFFLSFGTPVVTVRPFNTYGPRQSRRAVIPTIIGQCLAMDGGQGRLELGALHTTRDLNFVEDTVDGFVRALACDDVALGEAINLGSGREVSIGALAAMIADRCGVVADIVSTDQRRRPGASEVERLIADASKAHRLLGWESRVSLESGLDRTLAWFRGQHANHASTPRAGREAAYVV